MVAEEFPGRQPPDVPPRQLGDRLTTRPRRVVRSGAALPSRAGSRRAVPTARCPSRDAFGRGRSLRRPRPRPGGRTGQRRDRQPSTATPSPVSFTADRAHPNSGSSPSVVS